MACSIWKFSAHIFVDKLTPLPRTRSVLIMKLYLFCYVHESGICFLAGKHTMSAKAILKKFKIAHFDLSCFTCAGPAIEWTS